MTTIQFPRSVVFGPVDGLKPTLGLGAAFLDPALRRVFLALDSNGIGDVVNVVPLVQEITTARPDVEVVVVSRQWQIPFRWCAPRVSATPTPPSEAERSGPGTVYFDLTTDVRYHLYVPHWLQFFFISGVGTYTPHADPFPLMSEGELGGFTGHLRNMVGDARGYLLMHLENMRREWQGRNTDPENLLAIARVMSARGYRVFEIGNDNPPSGEFQHLGTLTIEELVYAMKGSAGFIGIDSFPMHVAALYDKPMLGFFAATQPEVVLPPVSRLTVLRNEEIPCNGCVYITRPRDHNTCTLGNLECTRRLPEPYVAERAQRLLEAIEQPANRFAPSYQLEHSWRMAQLLFEETLLLDRLRGKWVLTNELRQRIAASISSELN